MANNIQTFPHFNTPNNVGFPGNEDMLRVWKKNQKEVESFREKVSMANIDWCSYFTVELLNT